MSLESLPNELLLNIFEFFTCSHLLHAFIGLNSRFDTLLLAHIKGHSLDFQSVYKHDFDIVCRQYLPSIIDQITSICLSDDNGTPQQIQLFLAHGLTLCQFSNLRKLSLCNLSSEETMIQMMLECHHIPNLIDLDLTGFIFRSDKTRFQCFIDSIWGLPKLTYCNLDADLEYGRYSIAPTVISSSIKQLSLSGIQPCINPMGYLFDYTPCLQNFSSSITLKPGYVISPYAVLSITKLSIYFHSPATQYMIDDFLQMMSNLCQLRVRTYYINMNGHAWEQIIRNHLSKLKVFQLNMEIKIHDVNNKEGEVDALVDSFRSRFWLEEHGWFVRCDWIPDKQYTSIILYTLPYAFVSFDFNVPILFKSTSPHNDNHGLYDSVSNLYCNTALTGELSLCHVYFRHIHYLSIKLPINDQFWSIVPNFDQLTSLNVLLDDNNELGQSQLQSLLNRAPRLRSLRIKSCLSSTEQVLLTTGNSTNLWILRLLSQGYSQCFYNRTCVALSASSLGMQCRILEVGVNNRENIITLINGMTKLRALYVYCRDDKRNEKSKTTDDELIEWLQQHLPSTYPYTFNTITNSIITPNRSCNISACRSIVAYNILHNFLYNTTIFAECTGCSYANWPNFPADWSNRWNIQNFYITSSSGQDCQGNPRTGDLTQCQYWCLQDVTCVGFSRQKSVPDTYSNTQCYLKNNIQLNRVPNDNTWHTIAFNDTL